MLNQPARITTWILIIVPILAVVALISGYYIFSKITAPISSPITATSVTKTKSSTNKLTLWAWNTAADALIGIIPDFNKRYPDIQIEVIKIPYNEANQKFKIAVTTGEGIPDIWDTEGPVTQEYIKMGALLDITKQASKYKPDFVAYKWGEVSSSDGKIYALPWDTAPAGLFYRRDLLSAAGVDPASLTTWDAYIAAGKKVTKDLNGDGQPDQYMTLLSKTADVQETFKIILSQYGGTLYDANGHPAFNSPEGLATVNLMKKIYDATIGADIGWWSTEMFQAIKTNKIASLTQGVWMGGQIKTAAPDTAGKWGVVPLPAVKPGGIRTAVRGGSNLAITTKSTNPDAAWKFIEFALANKSSQLKMYKDFDIFPAYKPAYADPVFSQPNPFYADQVTSQVFITAQEQLHTNFYYGLKSTDLDQIISKEVIAALTGKKTPAQALKDADTTFNKLLGNN